MNKKILKLAIPSILANITVPLVGLVDIAVSGRVGSASAIGAIAVGSMLFDLLYWNFAFLRIGTGGLTAQSYGRRDFSSAIKYFTQGISVALISSLAILLIQYPFVYIAFHFIDSSLEVAHLAKEYFFIRVWAAPATLSLFVFKGWFIGMQNTVSPMVVDVLINILNLVLSIYLCLYTPLGFKGIALGTLIAQYAGLLLSIILFWRYYRRLFKYFIPKWSFLFDDLKRFFTMNGNLFVRSLCFMLIYAGFTTLAARYGDVQLAVGSVMMKLLLLFSYFIDGFAYAGEALVGRYIGAKEKNSLKRVVKLLFMWSGIIGVVFTVLYGVGGEWMLSVMSPNPIVLEGAKPYLFWLILMPIISCAAFMWDGIYIGATSSIEIRDSMIWSCVAFYIIVFIFRGSYDDIQPLWYAYFAHLVVRTIYLTLKAKKGVFAKC